MKNVIAVTFVALLVMVSCAGAQSYLPSIDVVLTKQTPNPAEPGQTMNLELSIQNDGYSEASNMVVEFVPKEPVGLMQGESAKRTFNKIPAAGSLKTTYRLYVDNAAISNEYELEFRIYSAGTPDNYIKKTITVSIQGIPQLVLDSVTTIPDNVEPGGLANIIFKIRNVGTGAARGMKATLASASQEIIPVYSSSLVYVGDINPNETANVDMEVSIDSSAEYKTYVNSLTMNYKDENNQNQVTTFSVGIPVMGSIKLSIIKVVANYEKNRIDVDLANKGTTDASSLEVRLMVNGEQVGIDYLSTLKATKKTTFSFPLVLQGSGQLVVDYVGPGLEAKQDRLDMIFDFVPQGSGGSEFFLLIILVVVGYFAWRRKWLQKFGLFKKKK